MRKNTKRAPLTLALLPSHRSPNVEGRGRRPRSSYEEKEQEQEQEEQEQEEFA